MKLHFICKAHYTNKDLLDDRFGRLYHLPVHLATLGATVRVSAFDYKSLIDREIFENGVCFRALPATPFTFLRAIYELWQDIKHDKPDVIIASGDSHIGYIASIMANKIGCRFVFDVYDYYPAFKGNRLPGMRYMFEKSLHRADIISCASKALVDKFYLFKAKKILVQNGVDRTLFKTSSMQEAKKKLGLCGQVVVGYFGSITSDRGPLLIESCEILREEIPTLKLLLAGKVSNISISKPWITYLGVLPQEKIPLLINACDVVTLPYQSVPFNDFSGACKISEYLACQKPVVATNVSTHVDVFADAPKSISNVDKNDFARALESQIRNPQVAPFSNEFTWEFISNQFNNALKLMIS